MLHIHPFCRRLFVSAMLLGLPVSAAAVPVLGALSDTAVYEDSLFAVTLSAVDTGTMGGTPEFFMLAGPAMMDLDAGTGRLQWIPENGDVGADTVVIRVTGSDSGADTGHFIITVLNTNDPPVFDPDCFLDGDAYEDSFFTGAVSAADEDAGDSLRYVLLHAPAGMRMDAVSGSLFWTPVQADAGTETLLVAVSDAAGAADSLTLELRVYPVNDPPVLLTTALDDAWEDSAYTFTLNAYDAENDPLWFAFDGGPDGMSFDTDSGIIRWLPGNDDVGGHTLSVMVSDGSDDDEAVFVLTVLNVNDAPVFTAVPDTYFTEDRLYRDTLRAGDVDAGDGLTYRLLRAPAGMALDSVSGALLWMPVQADAGHDTFVAVVRDRAGAADTLTTTYTVEAVNDPPVILSTVLDTAVEDSTYVFRISVSDEEDDPLIFYLYDGPEDMAMSVDSGVISWVPVNADVGSGSLTVVVADGSGNRTEAAFVITVLNTNDAPAVAVVEPASGDTLADSAVFVWSGADPDAGDTLTYVFEIAEDSAFTVTVHTVTAFAGTSLVLTDADGILVPGGRYYWRVTVSDGIAQDTAGVRAFIYGNDTTVSMVPGVAAGRYGRIEILVNGARMSMPAGPHGVAGVRLYRLDTGTAVGRAVPAAGIYAAVSESGADIRRFYTAGPARVHLTYLRHQE